MELLAFLTLTLSIFGSALAAMAALRAHYENEIFGLLKQMTVNIEAITGSGGGGIEPAERKKGRVLGWRKAWSAGQWVPIALFVMFLIYVVVMLWHATPAPEGNGLSPIKPITWTFVQWFVSCFLGVNIFCFFMALVARFQIRNLTSDISDLWKAADNGNGSGLTSQD